MIEPIALGRATIVGPHTRNFADTMKTLAASGAIVVTDTDGLPKTLRSLLEDSARRVRFAEVGAATIRANQGATERNAELLLSLLSQSAGGDAVGAAVGSAVESTQATTAADMAPRTERIRG